MVRKSSTPRASAYLRSASPILRMRSAEVSAAPVMTCAWGIIVLLAPLFWQRPPDDVGTPLAGHAERDLLGRYYSANANGRLHNLSTLSRLLPDRLQASRSANS